MTVGWITHCFTCSCAGLDRGGGGLPTGLSTVVIRVVDLSAGWVAFLWTMSRGGAEVEGVGLSIDLFTHALCISMGRLGWLGVWGKPAVFVQCSKYSCFGHQQVRTPVAGGVVRHGGGEQG